MTLSSSESYLQKVLSVIARRILVVSPNLTILAYRGPDQDDPDARFVGRPCHQALRRDPSSCGSCAVHHVLQTGRPATQTVEMPEDASKKIQRHFLPMFEGPTIEAVVILDQFFCEGATSGRGQDTSFLNNLIMSSVDGIIASDMKGRILIFNDAAEDMTGYAREQALLGLDIRNLYPGDGAHEVMRRLRSDDFGGPGKLKSYQVQLRRQDGITFPIELSASIVYEDCREVASVGFFYDLREKLRLQKELQSTQAQLMQAEKTASLGRLSAGLAHQLNNPLGGIVLYSRILQEDYDLEPRAKQDVDRIIQDAERCQNIVNGLLNFARQSQLEIRKNDINRALSQNVFLVENQPSFRGIEIISELDPGLPAVPSDIQQLNHAFINIILNAADAMHGGGRLTIKTRTAGTGDRVIVEIADNGPGIPGDVISHIFDPFFTTKEQGRGTGLGLSVAYGVIENHGGRITVCSAPGEGATFVIELPITTMPDDGSES